MVVEAGTGWPRPPSAGEQVAVLRRVDGVERRPHHLDVVLLQNSLLREFGGDVEPGLAAESGDDAVGLLDPDDFRDRLGRDRLDVHPVCGLGVGHDRRRVRVHQDDASALLLKGAARLCPGVVELGRLSDLDRSAADE